MNNTLQRMTEMKKSRLCYSLWITGDQTNLRANYYLGSRIVSSTHRCSTSSRQIRPLTASNRYRTHDPWAFPARALRRPSDYCRPVRRETFSATMQPAVANDALFTPTTYTRFPDARSSLFSVPRTSVPLGRESR